jgi:hypothetical protein
MAFTPGIDISTYQAVTPDLTGLSFVICRATYATGKDARYDMHSANVLKAGKVLGAYHFGRRAVDYSIASQVAAFISVARNAHLLALDLEADGGTLMSNSDAAAFIAALRANDPQHRQIILYHSLSGFPTNLGQDANWIAKWSTTPPSIAWQFWQNWNTYKGSGSNGDSDMYNGTVEQLRLFVGTGGDVASKLPLINDEPAKLAVKAGGAVYDLDGKKITEFYGDYVIDSPFGTRVGAQIYRAAYVSIGGVRQLTLITSWTVVPQPPPANDATHDVRLLVDGQEKAKVTV